jgi:predicted DNA-binding ArsR family transcriptional regulator
MGGAFMRMLQASTEDREGKIVEYNTQPKNPNPFTARAIARRIFRLKPDGQKKELSRSTHDSQDPASDYMLD